MTPEIMISEGIKLLEILAIDVALSGDNAIAVGLAAAGLPVEQRRKVIFWGLAGAVVLRVLFALVAAKLLLITGLQLLGGLLLVWVGWKLLTELREQDAADADHDGIPDHVMAHPKTLTSAIITVMIANLSMSPSGFSEGKKLERFEAGLTDLYRRSGLFVENPAAVEITEGVLYRARIPVPARVPVGTYRAETYLISRGRVLAVASRDVQIRKAGFERFVALAAERHGFLYGLSAVFLSLVLGYGASAVFRRR